MTNGSTQQQQVGERKFSLGLSYVEMMDLTENKLGIFLSYAFREEIIDWLQWNDPNGIYSDNASLCEFGTILSKEEGVEIIMGQVLKG